MRAYFSYLWAINVRVSLFFMRNSFFVFHCGRVDKLFFVANVNAWVPKMWVAIAKFIVWTHRPHNFLWQWQQQNKSKRASKKWNEIALKLLYGMANNKKFNQFNCIGNAFNAIQHVQYYLVWLWLWLWLQFNVVKWPNKRYFIMALMFGKKRKKIPYLAVKMEIPNSFSIRWFFVVVVCRRRRHRPLSNNSIAINYRDFHLYTV